MERGKKKKKRKEGGSKGQKAQGELNHTDTLYCLLP